MAVINDPNVAGNIMTVGQVAAVPAHFVSRALQASGHYRFSHRFDLANTQAANSRVFEIRNTHATNLMILEKLRISWIQVGIHTVAIQDSLDVFKATGFTAVDTTNTVTPAETRLRTSFPASDFTVRGVTVAGAAAGMTGGTVTVEANPFTQLPIWLLAAVPTAGPTVFNVLEYILSREEMPFALIQNEGLVIQNRVLLGATAGSTVFIDCEVAEVTAY